MPPPAPSSPLKLALAVYLPLVAAACAWIAGNYGAETLAKRLLGPDPIPSLLAGIAAGTLLVAACRGSSERWSEVRRVERALAALVGRLTPRECVVLALLSGVAEEVFFRGALQPEVGLLWTTLIFGALHAPVKRDLLLWTPFALAAGFLFGVLFEVLGSIVAPAAAHVLVNAINLRALARSHEARAASAGP